MPNDAAAEKAGLHAESDLPTLLPRSCRGSIIKGRNRDRLRARGLPRIDTV